MDARFARNDHVWLQVNVRTKRPLQVQTRLNRPVDGNELIGTAINAVLPAGHARRLTCRSDFYRRCAAAVRSGRREVAPPGAALRMGETESQALNP